MPEVAIPQRTVVLVHDRETVIPTVSPNTYLINTSVTLVVVKAEFVDAAATEGWVRADLYGIAKTGERVFIARETINNLDVGGGLGGVGTTTHGEVAVIPVGSWMRKLELDFAGHEQGSGVGGGISLWLWAD